VCAALQYTISNRRYNESIFWIKELIESKEDEKIFETLFLTWFHNIGLGNLEILKNILTVDMKNEDDLYNLVYGMTMLKENMRDCTLPVMFLYGASNATYKNRNVYFQLPANLIQPNTKIDTFIRAVLLGKYLESWLLYQTTDVSNMIDSLINTKFKNHDIVTLIKKLRECNINDSYKMCALIGILCTKEDILLKAQGCIKTIDNDTTDEIARYYSIEGKRKRRILNIPRDCLYGKTKRGTMPYTESNISELYDVEYIIENSKVIDLIIESFGSYESFVEDTEHLDNFMKWYFPDDIPDEWSREDQEKSHGYGVNQPSDKPLIRRYFTRWVNLKSNCKIWDKETIVCNAIQRIQNEFDDFYIEKKLLNKYSENKIKIEKESNIWNLRSLKYILSDM
jgi:hypothetical protein